MGRYSSTNSRPWWRSTAAIAGLTVAVAAGATVGIATAVTNRDANASASDAGNTDGSNAEAVTVAEDSTAPSGSGSDDPTNGEATDSGEATCTELDPLTIAATPAIVDVLEAVAPQACIDLEVVEATSMAGSPILVNMRWPLASTPLPPHPRWAGAPW